MKQGFQINDFLLRSPSHPPARVILQHAPAFLWAPHLIFQLLSERDLSGRNTSCDGKQESYSPSDPLHVVVSKRSKELSELPEEIQRNTRVPLWLREELEGFGMRFKVKAEQHRVIRPNPCGERMEESYETFEEELGTPRADPPPYKSVGQIRRPEMYAARKIREEMAPASQQPRAEPKTLLKEPSFPKTPSLSKTLSTPNLAQIETPWENVTLNRCLFVAITILVLTSGFQRLHETLRSRGTLHGQEEEVVGLKVRRSETLRHRGQPSEPQTSLWEVMLLWLPDLDDEEDEEEEDDDVEVKRGRAKGGAMSRTPRGLRNRPLPDRKLTKQRDGKLKDRRVRKARDEQTKDKKKRDEEELEEAVREEDEDQGGDEEIVPEKNKRLEEKREKKGTQKESSTVI
ncbi:junctional sarcoplasmic reticulum protein 1 [Limanda limanda]|uniref:junctional sarcoplasmic reticulum protein 1 n=1 Tax=Limanda limanda TaxID=27771 RepID=UPI0029C6CCB3|nr:junctional sarcoplasmic reticulum protein 1 [Limanda limanda]